MIFIATPVRVIPKIYSDIHSYLLPQAMVFDLGSTRQWVFDHLIPAPNNNLYCGFHPMGGGVEGGARFAQQKLFKGRPLLVTPYRSFKDGEKILLRDYKLPGEPGFFLTAPEHDRVCALVSHLPHVIANVYASQVYEKDYSFSQFAGSSFRDLTRIAGSSPEVWLDIFLTNQAQILSVIDELEGGLRIIKEFIKTEDEDGLKAFLIKVKKIKEQVDDYGSL